VSEPTASTALIASGPPPWPRSEISRHTARNRGRPTGGDASAPSVMSSPADRPLPRPMSMATAMSVARSVVSGSSAYDRPRMTIDGTATARLPYRSMALPAG